MRATDAVRDTFAAQALTCSGQLFGQAYSHTRNAAAAEDLVQDTLARGLERFHQFKPGTNLKAWLSRIMANLFINQCRYRRRRPEVASFEGMANMVQAPTAPAPALQLEGLTAGQVMQDERFLQSLDPRMKSGLEELPQPYREALLLNTVGNLSCSEVARTLRLPQGTVMSRLHRARQAMRKAYAGA